MIAVWWIVYCSCSQDAKSTKGIINENAEKPKAELCGSSAHEQDARRDKEGIDRDGQDPPQR
jgi:hypothetical protein